MAAGFLLVIGLGGLAVTQFNDSGPDSTLASGDIREAIRTVSDPNAKRTDAG